MHDLERIVGFLRDRSCISDFFGLNVLAYLPVQLPYPRFRFLRFRHHD